MKTYRLIHLIHRIWEPRNLSLSSPQLSIIPITGENSKFRYTQIPHAISENVMSGYENLLNLSFNCEQEKFLLFVSPEHTYHVVRVVRRHRERNVSAWLIRGREVDYTILSNIASIMASGSSESWVEHVLRFDSPLFGKEPSSDVIYFFVNQLLSNAGGNFISEHIFTGSPLFIRFVTTWTQWTGEGTK